MNLQIPPNCKEEIRQVLEVLIEAKINISSKIVGFLVRGECSHLSDDLYGYPYDYELYAKDSLDTDVQILNRLLENVEHAFLELVTEDQKKNGR